MIAANPFNIPEQHTLPILASLHRLWHGSVSAETAALTLITRIARVPPVGARYPAGTARPREGPPTGAPTTALALMPSSPACRLQALSSRHLTSRLARSRGDPGLLDRPGASPFPPPPPAAERGPPRRPIPGRVPPTALASRSDTPFRNPHDISCAPVPFPPELNGFAMPDRDNSRRLFPGALRAARARSKRGKGNGRCGERGRREEGCAGPRCGRRRGGPDVSRPGRPAGPGHRGGRPAGPGSPRRPASRAGVRRADRPRGPGMPPHSRRTRRVR
jgi:hypothetical protein